MLTSEPIIVTNGCLALAGLITCPAVGSSLLRPDVMREDSGLFGNLEKSADRFYPSINSPPPHTQIRTWYQELCVCGGSWWTGRIGLHSLQGYRKSSASLYPRIGSPSFSYIIIVSIRLTGWLSLSRMFSSLGFQALPPSTCLCSSLTPALPDPFLSLTVSVRTQSENMQVIQTEKLWYEELFTTSVSFYILEKVAKRRSGRGL